MKPGEANLFVIDDDESVRVSLGRLLRSLGRECSAFASAEEFLSALRHGERGCALIDVHMPGMNGIDLVHALRDSGSGVGVVLMSAFDDPEARKLAAAAGISILRKPFDDAMLLRALDDAAVPAPRRAGKLPTELPNHTAGGC